ncbi:MAG TPA: acyl carrier protein [Allosphingosinicella sp.]|nr:acyl carrier protein [Allosphingosinicella sp.]
MSEFYEGLAEILEVDVDQVTPELDLEEGGWDSLAVVSTIALIDDVFDVTVHPDRLGDCKTVGDIEALVESERAQA